MFYPLLVFCQVTCFGQTPANDPHWQLVWEDNFNTLNTNIWLVANNFDHYSGTPNGYGEPQVYTNRPSNVSIDNGNLVLKAIKENYSCPNINLNEWGCSYQNTYGVPYQYTSGWVESKVPYRPKFGYVETRINCPMLVACGLLSGYFAIRPKMEPTTRRLMFLKCFQKEWKIALMQHLKNSFMIITT